MAVDTSSSDIELINKVGEYDSKALEVLYNRYSPLLYTLIKKITGEEEIAEDVLTEVFAIIWKKIDHFDFEKGNVYTWLITLARNKAVDVVRRQRNGDEMAEYNDDYEDKFIIPTLSPEIDALDLKTSLNIKESVESAIEKLTDAQQYVIYLAYYEGYTEAEIAGKLNIPVSTVKSKIRLAVNNLKTYLIEGDS